MAKKQSMFDVYFYSAIWFIVGCLFMFNTMNAWVTTQAKEAMVNRSKMLDLRWQSLALTKESMELREDVVFQMGRVQMVMCDRDPKACNITTYNEFVKYSKERAAE